MQEKKVDGPVKTNDIIYLLNATRYAVNGYFVAGMHPWFSAAKLIMFTVLLLLFQLFQPLFVFPGRQTMIPVLLVCLLPSHQFAINR